jgi:hypothetical protein
MWKKVILSVACAVFIVFCLYVVISERAKKGADARSQIAVSEAKAWLTLLDQRKYKQVWESSATHFKSEINLENFQKMIVVVRHPQWRLKERKLATIEYRPSLPQAPPGEYVIIKFDLFLKGHDPAHEVVTTVKDIDGKWRVTGYFIKNGFISPPAKPGK